MTENEAKAFLKIEKQCINRNCDRNCAKCDIVQKVEDLNSAYDTAIKALEEVQQYRAIGTPEECRAAMEKQNSANKELESHDEKRILECCISLMQEMVNEFAKWYRWQHGEEERFCFKKSYFRIVQELFLLCTHHSGGTSTRAKCEQLGVDSSEEIEFDWSDEE